MDIKKINLKDKKYILPLLALPFLLLFIYVGTRLAEKKQELERVQGELTSLNGALSSAHAMLNKVMDDIELDGDSRMEVADLLMK